MYNLLLPASTEPPIQNDIPVFCPALTDGSLGDMIYFHSFRNPGLIVDIVRDIRALNELSRKSKKAGMIILGGGVCKHQIANAMLIVSYNRDHYSGSYLPSEMAPITLYTSSVSKYEY